MTPEVKRLVETARRAISAIEAAETFGQCDLRFTRANLECAIRAVEALDDPKAAHEAAIARRVAEDDGGREHAESMGIDGDYGQQDIAMGR